MASCELQEVERAEFHDSNSFAVNYWAFLCCSELLWKQSWKLDVCYPNLSLRNGAQKPQDHDSLMKMAFLIIGIAWAV